MHEPRPLNGGSVTLHFEPTKEQYQYQKIALYQYRIVGNFQGRNFCEFCSFVAIRKSFRYKIWCSKSEQSTKVFSAKIVFFSLKVSRYMVAAKIV